VSLVTKESDIVCDHVLKFIEEVPKCTNLRGFTKAYVEVSNIRVLCSKIREMKSELHKIKKVYNNDQLN